MRTYIEQKTKATLRHLARDYVYTVRRGVAKGLQRKGGLGFVPQFSELSAEERFIASLDLRGQTVYDIGAHEGVMTLFFAKAVGPTGQLITFEPNPVSYDRLQNNVSLNRFENVKAFQLAMGNRQEKALLAIRPDDYATGSMDPAIKAQILHERGTLMEVKVDTLDHRVEALALPLPDLIKIDVEGYELNVLNGMTKVISASRPIMFVELHGAGLQHKRENVNQVIRFASA